MNEYFLNIRVNKSLEKCFEEFEKLKCVVL